MIKELEGQVVEVRCKSDSIISIKLVLGSEILNVVSIYAPQKGTLKGYSRRN